MNKILLLLGIVILFGCNSNPKQAFPIPNEKDINEIVKAVIKADSVYFSDKKLSVDLYKIKIVRPNSIDGVYIPPPVGGNLNINQLIDTVHYKKLFFSKKDSLYLLFQNDTLKKFRIDSSLVTNFKTTTNAIQAQNRKIDKPESFIQISIPIFSLDQNHAYIQNDYLCSTCGGGMGIFLEKIKGHWKIVQAFRTWYS
ncbi:MAG: hypothetical protein ABI367_14470 [Mucilaginibacter sp.]